MFEVETKVFENENMLVMTFGSKCIIYANILLDSININYDFFELITAISQPE